MKVLEYPEGATSLDPDEMEGLKYPHIDMRKELDEIEQQNIQDGYNWLTRQRKHKDFLTEAFVKDLHQHLFGDVWTWAGSFRQSEKNIGIDPFSIGVELRKLLDDARYWVENATYERKEFAARFHHRLVKIHPFPNGNGRHGRIMTDVILEKVLEVPAVEWGVTLSGQEGEHRKAYIQALQKADNNDYQMLIEFIK
ncbi:MAG: mobile mystery protein B [Gammaproteobacteria bacterium]|nr:mobile mystery protein B [Gammaproteobacteria bacterium]MCF6260579.1 mobile mystery protein B [Gammaproteobacteria bacterium]